MQSLTCCLLLLTLLAIQHQQLASAAIAWGYGNDNGPAFWPKLEPKWCSGRRQSPIHLQESVAELNTNLVPHTIGEALAGTKFLVKNDGKKIIVDFKNSVNVSMGGDMVNSCYRPHSIHWHWGSVSSKGSEHWMEGKQYPMEGHIVMWDCRYYRTFEEAAGSFDGLAVLGVLYEESATPDNSAGIDAINSAMATNPELMRCPTANCTGVEINAFSLKSLLPSDLSSYFMYDGSLTTPGCSENVLWTVFKTPLKIPSGFLQKFRDIRTSDNKALSDNFRTLQELNPARPVGGSRKLTRSFGTGSSVIGNPAAHLKPAAAFGAVLLLLQVVMVMLR